VQSDGVKRYSAWATNYSCC